MKFALIGHPVSHSLSPAIHQAAYRELGETHEYSLIDAPTEADVDRVVARLRSGELSGANVTTPWKRHAFAASDRHSALAERLGVVNVLAPQAAEIIGHNTDALALEAEFRQLVSSPRAVLIGSGGAAPAVVAACQAAGIFEVFVSARRFTADSAPESWPGAAELTRLGASLLAWPEANPSARARFDEMARGAGLVVQCTSAGMHGADSGEQVAALIPWASLAADALAYDLVYLPLLTPFLLAAGAAGRRTSHGLNMLIGQARLSIEIWLGKRPAAEPLRQAALSALAARGQA